MRKGAAVLGFGSMLAFGCIDVEPLPAPETGAIALSATDFAGKRVPFEQLPRRPHLRLHHPDGFAEPAAVYLFEGAAVPELVADLERSPLSADHLARALPCDLEPHGEELVVTPAAPLAASGAETP